MKFYTFGKRENPAILLLPGTCCHWKRNFGEVIPMLERDFYVVCVSYDGFDETEDTVFPNMLIETAKIEDYIRDNFDSRICAAYGCSLGGSFVGLLVQRKRIRIDHAILGSSDLDQETGPFARFKAWLITPLENSIAVSGTQVHIFYAAKMGEAYEARYHKYFQKPDIRRHDLQHEELLTRYPEKWSEEIRRCCGMN